MTSSYALLPGSRAVEQIATTVSRGGYRSVIFDFDGTLSLIRQGWREIMVPMMVAVLAEVQPDAPEADLEAVVTDYVDRLTGKQTIYQMMALCDEIRKRGGTPEAPIAYKNRFNDLLNAHIADRIDRLERGVSPPDEMMVVGARDLLDNLLGRGLVLYLASGTDHRYVQKEADMLGLRPYFNDRIFGALDNYADFSKAKVIQNILKTHAIRGPELLGFGDGYVEIENVKAVGGTAVGVASDEVRREGINAWKRDRLIAVGADFIVPEYREQALLVAHLCGD